MDLKPFVEEVEKQKLNVEGVIVFQQGKEPTIHRWIPEIRRNIFSVSKNFTSIAIGMAIEEGKLGLNDRVSQVFKREAADSRWDSLTLKHLLTMTMGHPEFTRPSSVKEALSYQLTRDPGTFFLYDNTCSFLASAMLTEAVGLKLRDYLLDKLFRPLGIPDPEWPESEDGYTIGATALMLNTSEMALFGKFLLQRGKWEGKQLVPAAWIDGATRTQVPTQPSCSEADNDLGYGYQFWTSRHGAYRCDGRDGQLIIVFPGLDAVVTINSDEEKAKLILWAVWDHILPQLTHALS